MVRRTDAPGQAVKKPRLIYYNDAHHFHAKRLEPPLSLRKLHWPVDEVVGTGVDLLVLGLGYGDVYFHDSKVGRVVGQGKEQWQHLIDWRIMRMVQEARRLGTDQVRAVIERGRELGVAVFPSLKLQDSAIPGSERCGRLKMERGAEVCLGGPEGKRERWAYDFAHERVRRDKLEVAREVLEEYRADGLELDFMFEQRYFREGEEEANIPLMSRFVGQVRELADRIGQQQGRHIPLMARVHSRREENLHSGLDVETWLREGSLDLVVAQVPYACFETDPSEGQWLAEAAKAVGAGAYLRPARRVYDERTIHPSIEMFRALGQALQWQGFAGLYLGYLPWPFSGVEYQILREAAFPEVVARRDKRYLLAPREGSQEATTTPERVLPLALEEGKRASIPILIADDLESAQQEGEMRAPILTLRLADFCCEDQVEFCFNGRALSLEEAEITDERALRIPAQFPSPVMAPLGFAAHWFRWWLPVELLRRGENVLEVETRKLARTADWVRWVNGVEVQTRFRDFTRPQGLEVERIAPRG